MFQNLKIGKPKILQAYVHADYVEDLDEQRSTTDYVFTIAESVVS